ncbi:hypothetical protein [Blastococcus tunisiensis]|uniref:ABC-2 type transport system permease protein n=1 Tax=Blastococcus tunisiensis TaxID=1798228 RepID=A0A1I2IYH7_9ACTN|nr:hypothetical protein [Blastococcus sp. DSM 46838]SFF46778.1 hypothetical protein SAMN05216574_11493 [Blastococcus sp. DSM 46838]
MTAPTLPAADRLPDVPAPGLGTLVRVELRKSADTRAGFWLLVSLGVLALAAPALILFFADPPDKALSEYVAVAQLPVALLLPVLGILLVTSEWSQRTALSTFALVPQRSRVLLAKLLAAVVLGGLGVVATLLSGVLAVALTPVLTADPASWSLEPAQVAQTALAQVLVVLVGVAFGLLLLSSPLAIVVYFALPTAFTVLVSTVASLDWLRDWWDLTTTTGPMYSGDLQGEGWAQVGTSTLLWLVVPLVAGWIRVQRSEIA